MKDGQKLNPGTQDWMTSIGNPCTQLQTNGARNVVLSHLLGGACTHHLPPSISPFSDLCLFLLNGGSCYAFQKADKQQAEN